MHFLILFRNREKKTPAQALILFQKQVGKAQAMHFLKIVSETSAYIQAIWEISHLQKLQWKLLTINDVIWYISLVQLQETESLIQLQETKTVHELQDVRASTWDRISHTAAGDKDSSQTARCEGTYMLCLLWLQSPRFFWATLFRKALGFPWMMGGNNTLLIKTSNKTEYNRVQTIQTVSIQVLHLHNKRTSMVQQLTTSRSSCQNWSKMLYKSWLSGSTAFNSQILNIIKISSMPWAK